MSRGGITHEQYAQHIEDMHGDDITLMSRYTRQLDEIVYRHNPCGAIYKKKAGSLRTMMFGCDPCAREFKREKAAWTNEHFLTVIDGLVGGEYSFTERYKGYGEKIGTRHNECGYSYKVSPGEFIRQGSRCPQCAISIRAEKKTLTHVEWFPRVAVDLGDEYTLLDEYERATKKLRIRHNSCGTVFSRTPGDLERIVKCTVCPGEKRMTTGEVAVAEWLIANGLEYDHEVTFEDCYHILPLRFDFAVLDEDHDVKILIEFNGRQHYEPIEFFGGQKTFDLTVLRDNIKKEYAESNNIPLITVRYDDDVDAVLSKLIAR